MPNVLHVTNTPSALDAYASVVFAATGDVWITCDVKFVGTLPVGAGNLTGYFAMFDSGGAEIDGVFLKEDSGAHKLWSDYSSAGPWTAFADSQWYRVNFRCPTTATEEVWLDGVDLGSDGPPGAGTPDGASFGQRFADEGGYDVYIANIKIGTTRGGSEILAVDMSSGSLATAFDSSFADSGATIEIVNDPTAPNESGNPPDTSSGNRFYDTPDWRFVITDLDLRVLTILNPYATARSVTKTLGAALVIEGQVDGDNPKVNLTHADGHPFLSEGDRFLFGFRRDGDAPADPWTCRAATIILDVNPVAESDWATVKFVGYDPRQTLYKRPCRDEAGVPAGDTGIVYTNTSARDILVSQLERSETYDGNTYIDLTGANLNQTAAIATYTIQQGITIGELMDDLERGGTIEILLDPVWLVTGASGAKIVELATYDQAGVDRSGVYFAWDRPGRNAESIDIKRDGGERENAVRTHYGQGGDAVTTYEDAASQARFGTYWGELFLPGIVDAAAAELVAAKRLQLQAYGKRTIAVRVSPERAAAPLKGYDIGDRVFVVTSAAALEAVGEEQRVRSIPIAIDDYGVETVAGLVFDEDGWSAAS